MFECDLCRPASWTSDRRSTSGSRRASVGTAGGAAELPARRRGRSSKARLTQWGSRLRRAESSVELGGRAHLSSADETPPRCQICLPAPGRRSPLDSAVTTTRQLTSPRTLTGNAHQSPGLGRVEAGLGAGRAEGGVDLGRACSSIDCKVDWGCPLHFDHILFGPTAMLFTSTQPEPPRPCS